MSQDGATGATLTFKNVIIQDCSFTQLDSNGYMIYNCVDATGNNGYYLTDGKAIPISWYKNDYSAITKFYDKNGNEITVNDGPFSDRKEDRSDENQNQICTEPHRQNACRKPPDSTLCLPDCKA